MNRQNILAGVGIGALVLAVAWFSMHRSPDNGVDHPEGFTYVCLKPGCGNEFHLSTREFNDYVSRHPGEYIKCPKCGGDRTQRKDAAQRP